MTRTYKKAGRHKISLIRRIKKMVMRGELDSLLLAAGKRDKDVRRDHINNCCKTIAAHVHVANLQTKKTQLSLAAVAGVFSIAPRTLDRCIWTLRRCGILYTVAAAHVVEYHDFYHSGKKIYRVKAATRILTEMFFDKLKINAAWIKYAIENPAPPRPFIRDYEVERMLAAGASATMIHIVQWKLRHGHI